MQRVVIVSSVLGLGSAIVFAAAALTAAMFPTGPLVPGGWNGSVMAEKGFMRNDVVIPMPAPVIVDEGKDVELQVDDLVDRDIVREPVPTD